MEIKERNTILSTLWIFVTANYIYCDLITLMNPQDLKMLLTGTIGSIQITQGFLLGASVLMEIPLAMIILSRILTHRINRNLNIIAGTIMTIVQIASLFAGTPTMHYIFFSIIEISTTLFITAFAMRYSEQRLRVELSNTF